MAAVLEPRPGAPASGAGQAGATTGRPGAETSLVTLRDVDFAYDERPV
jgi:hypothetical protein